MCASISLLGDCAESVAASSTAPHRANSGRLACIWRTPSPSGALYSRAISNVASPKTHSLRRDAPEVRAVLQAAAAGIAGVSRIRAERTRAPLLHPVDDRAHPVETVGRGTAGAVVHPRHQKQASPPRRGVGSAVAA